MAQKPDICQAEWVLTPVTICDRPTVVRFELGKPLLPPIVEQPPSGPKFQGFKTIDACQEHAEWIARELTRRGHEPKRIPTV